MNQPSMALEHRLASTPAHEHKVPDEVQRVTPRRCSVPLSKNAAHLMRHGLTAGKVETNSESTHWLYVCVRVCAGVSEPDAVSVARTGRSPHLRGFSTVRAETRYTESERVGQEKVAFKIKHETIKYATLSVHKTKCN